VQCDRTDFGDNVEFQTNSIRLSGNADIPIWSAANAIEICNARYVNVTSYPGELVEDEGRELSFQRGEVVAGSIISAVPHLPIEVSIDSEVWDPSVPVIIRGANPAIESETSYPYNGAIGLAITRQSSVVDTSADNHNERSGKRLGGTLIGEGVGAIANDQIATYPDQQPYNSPDIDPSTDAPMNAEAGLAIDLQSEGGGVISSRQIAVRSNRLGGTLIGGGATHVAEDGNTASPDLQYGSTLVSGPEISVQPMVRITSTATCPSLEEMAESVLFAPDSDQIDEKAKESIRKAVGRSEGSYSAEREIHLSAFSRRTWQMNETGLMPKDIDILEYGRLVSVANYIASLPGFVPEDIKGGIYGSMCHNYSLPDSANLEYHRVDIKIVPKIRVDIAKGTYHRMVAGTPAYYPPPVSYGQPMGAPGGPPIGGSLPVENSQAGDPVAPTDDR
jgi:hypothetical protein